MTTTLPGQEMAVAVLPPSPAAPTCEPHRGVCPDCLAPVLIAELGERLVVAEAHEWEPRARCYVCSTIAARGQRRSNCDRCGGSGYVGERRPAGRMLAVDVAWSDEGHVRLVGPRTTRKRGEALYPLHGCDGRLALVA